MVSNILKTLPASIGLLRKLHTLYLDDNLLSELPKEIGSCTSLSVLSVSKNRLKEIPSEIGHLSNLKVFTLSGNLIVHLPVSILNIHKLGALWLSESQSKPFLQLNKEIDPSTGQHVLTCYLLPQLPYSIGKFFNTQSPHSRSSLIPSLVQSLIVYRTTCRNKNYNIARYVLFCKTLLIV
jgi:Leucine-rich repeat (LRR) protein